MAYHVAHQQAPVVVGESGEQGEGHPQDQAGHKQPLFVALVVRQGAQHRGQNRHQERGDRGAVGPEHQVVRPGGLAHAAEVDGKQHRHDVGGVHGVGPVVQDPAFFGLGEFFLAAFCHRQAPLFSRGRRVFRLSLLSSHIPVRFTIGLGKKFCFSGGAGRASLEAGTWLARKTALSFSAEQVELLRDLARAPSPASPQAKPTPQLAGAQVTALPGRRGRGARHTSLPRQQSSRAWVISTGSTWPWRGVALAARTGV